MARQQASIADDLKQLELARSNVRLGFVQTYAPHSDRINPDFIPPDTVVAKIISGNGTLSRLEYLLVLNIRDRGFVEFQFNGPSCSVAAPSAYSMTNESELSLNPELVQALWPKLVSLHRVRSPPAPKMPKMTVGSLFGRSGKITFLPNSGAAGSGVLAQMPASQPTTSRTRRPDPVARYFQREAEWNEQAFRDHTGEIEGVSSFSVFIRSTVTDVYGKDKTSAFILTRDGFHGTSEEEFKEMMKLPKIEGAFFSKTGDLSSRPRFLVICLIPCAKKYSHTPQTTWMQCGDRWTAIGESHSHSAARCLRF